MIVGWTVLEKYVVNPNYKYGQPYADRGKYVPTGEQQCPDCFFTTNVADNIGIHTCPQVTDGAGNPITIGSEVLIYAKSRIRKGHLSRYKKATGMYTVTCEDAEGNESKYVAGDRGRLLAVEQGTGE